MTVNDSLKKAIDVLDKKYKKQESDKTLETGIDFMEFVQGELMEQLPEVRMLVSQRLIVLTEILIMYFLILVQVLPLHLLIPITQMKNTYRNCSKIQT